MPVQPVNYEESLPVDQLHNFSFKNKFNKPSTLRKLKNQAQDYKFAEENIFLHSAIDVVRPF